MNRHFLLNTVLIFLIVFYTSCSPKGSHKIEWIPFSWETAEVSGRTIEKAAMLIPATIDSIPQRFVMQLDLGAVTTIFYGITLNEYIEKYSSLKDKLDSTKTFIIGGEEYPMFNDVTLQLGEVPFKNIEAGLFSDFGHDYSDNSDDSGTEILVGTIAPDLFQDKILIIDYKHNRLAVTDTLPPDFEDASFENYKSEHGRIKIPFLINESTEYLMFDTGASIFTLVTGKQNATKIGGTEIADSLSVPSWGEFITFYGLKTVAPIQFGEKRLESTIVYYNEDKSWDDFYESENIWGVTGNAYFWNNVIIIDYKNNRFGIK